MSILYNKIYWLCCGLYICICLVDAILNNISISLYRGGQFYWWKPEYAEKTRVADELYHKLYRVHQLRTWIELAHLVVMGTDCMVTSLRCDILTNRVRWIIPATRNKKVNLVMKIRKERNKLEKTFAAWKPHQWCVMVIECGRSWGGAPAGLSQRQ